MAALSIYKIGRYGTEAEIERRQRGGTFLQGRIG
jgi:hypothetical protein